MTEQIIESSGNVFADLGLEDAEELSLKATLAMQVADDHMTEAYNLGLAQECLGKTGYHFTRDETK